MAKTTKYSKDRELKRMEEEYLLFEGEQLKAAYTFFFFTGKDLREFRDKLRINSARLSKRLFVSKQYIHAVEKAENTPIPKGLAWRLTRAFKLGITAITKEEIISGKNHD